MSLAKGEKKISIILSGLTENLLAATWMQNESICILNQVKQGKAFETQQKSLEKIIRAVISFP